MMQSFFRLYSPWLTGWSASCYTGQCYLWLLGDIFILAVQLELKYFRGLKNIKVSTYPYGYSIKTIIVCGRLCWNHLTFQCNGIINVDVLQTFWVFDPFFNNSTLLPQSLEQQPLPDLVITLFSSEQQALHQVPSGEPAWEGSIRFEKSRFNQVSRLELKSR